jgi:hypothetical protein
MDNEDLSLYETETEEEEDEGEIVGSCQVIKYL